LFIYLFLNFVDSPLTFLFCSQDPTMDTVISVMEGMVWATVSVTQVLELDTADRSTATTHQLLEDLIWVAMVWAAMVWAAMVWVAMVWATTKSSVLNISLSDSQNMILI
jgi:hypothetical protein